MRPIADIRKEGEELGYRDADLREFVKDQQALEREREIADRAERAAVRQQQKLDAETEQKKIDAAQEQTRLEIKAAREKEKREAEMAAEEKKREAEIAAEEKRMTAEEKKREADMAMERERREAELQLRKMTMEEEKMRIEAGQNTDSRRTSTSGNGFSAKVPRLPVFHDNKDNIGAYIERFERFATTHHWPRETWASSLSALITGKALEVYSRLSADEADDFDVLKKALLDRYNLNAEGFRMKLRDSVADEGESPAQFITRLDSYLNKWIELSKIPKTFAGMVQLVLTEQFTSTCSNDLATFLKERTCGSLKDLGETANKYLEAHGKQMKDASKKTNTSRSQNSSSGKPTCSYCHRMGHVVKECKAKKQAESSDSQQQGSSRVECWACGKKGHMFRECKKWDGDKEAAGVGIDRRNVKCFLCSQMGHISSNCPEKWKKSEKVGCSQEYEDRETDTEVGATALVSEVSDGDTSDEDIEISNVIWTRNKGEMPVYRGKVGKHSVQTLRDTGCSCVVVKRKFVKDGQLTGKTRAVIQMLGTSARLPVAKIDIDTPYLKGEVEALCAEDSLYDLIIGNVEGAREPRDPNPEWEEGGAMETRAQKKKTMGNRPLKVKDCQDEDITPEEYLKRQQEDRSYDKRSRPRRLKTGDEVLVLLPTNQNKLLMQWKGPYPVTEIVGVNDYRVKVKGKNKTYHINLLKEYVSRKEGAVEESQSMMELAGAAVIEYEEGKVESVIDEEQLLDTRRTSEKETYKDVKISSKLSASQKRDMKNLVFQYRDVFTDKPGTTNLAEHKIEMVTDDPVRVKPYPIPYSLREELKQDIEQMLDMGVIRKSDSPYSSPIVIVRKKDGSNRICIDFRRVNKLSRFDSEPMIRPQDIFSRISQDKYYSKFDMTKGYWQIPMRKQDIAKTSFVTPDGCYEFVKMPFGLMNSGATFTRMMRRLLEGVRNVEHYIDDCLVHTESWEQHMETLKEFLGRVRRAKLTVRPSKCEMGFENMEFVGHEVKKGEIGLHADNIKKIREAPRPKTKTQVRSFLGLTGFYRGYIDKYAEIAEPLTDLTKKKSPNVIKWGETQEKAFSILKWLLVAEPILRLPDMTKPFLLRTDASDAGIGAVLLQQHEGKLFPVAYASKKLLPRERNYSIMEKECLAVVWAVKRFNVYLYGAPFVLQTDHQPLAYLNRAKFTNGRITRWALFLQPYSITIEAIKGSQNVGADYMSRV